MRLKLFVCGVTTLVPALILAGCGVDTTTMITPNVQGPTIVGRAMGGQQPVTGATIEVVAVGTAGYGSPGTVLSSTTTDLQGNFRLPAYTCPQSNTPVYLLGIGGNAGAGTNNSAVEAASLGGCAFAQKSFVIMNEVTTAAAAYVFSHFFSTTPPTGSTVGGDSIGGPSTTTGTTVNYSQGILLGANHTQPLLVTNFDGAANQGSSGVTVEWLKINTIANILSACINSSGEVNATETKTSCGKLFNLTDHGAAVRPTDTFQAAVQMALQPAGATALEVADLYALIGGVPPFTPYLTAAPHDYSVGVSYTTSSFGLGVDTGAMTTLDIDSTGRIWFPSNASGQIGVAYFDPRTETFSGPFNTTSLGHPTQVAIDANGYAWLNDGTKPTVSGYLTTSPTLTKSVSFPATTSQALTIGGDNRVNVGITIGGRFELANISADRTSYSLASGVVFAAPVVSMAGDTSNGDVVDVVDTTTPRMRYYYVTAPASSVQDGAASAFAGQAIFTGNDDISVRSFTTAGTNHDGLCLHTAKACYNFGGAPNLGLTGLAIDGASQLWLASTTIGGVVEVPVNFPGNPAGGGSVYLNPNGALNIPFKEFVHNGTDGETATAPLPYGMGIDDAGNLWMTNAGCNINSCVPSSPFTLTEIIGAAYPTITPVSAQITSGDLVGTEPTF